MRKSYSLVLFAALFTLGFSQTSGDPIATGSISGQVVFRGGSAESALPTDAVIYLRGEGLPAGTNTDQPLLDQSDIIFTPRVLPVVVGSEVEIRNSDGIAHNVHSKSKANRPFNKSQLAGMSMTVVFKRPEVVMISCDIHSQMKAFIVALPNRYFTRADKKGNYSIPDVPAGTYELVGWHEKYGTITQSITVNAGTTTQAVVQFEPVS